MRILLSFLQDNGGPAHNIPAYRFWAYYIKNGIEEAGMQYLEIPRVDWAAGLVPHENDPALQLWKQQTWEQTVNYIRANLQHFDIFLCYLYPKQIDVQAIQRIKALGVPCVNFYCDHIRSFTKLPPEFKVFDVMWVPEFETLDLYEAANVAHINLPMPMWVDHRYRNVPGRETEIISFIGSKDELRAQLLSNAIAGGLQVQIRGNGWTGANEPAIGMPPSNVSSKIINQLNLLRNSGIKKFTAYHLKRFDTVQQVSVPTENIFEKPDFDNYIRLSRESYITLGINRVPTFNTFNKKMLTYSRLRDLEAPMLGACYLTEYTAGLPHLYEPGIEIETYANADELLYKSNELATSKSRRKELRLKGQQKALNTHTIPQSLQKLKARLFK